MNSCNASTAVSRPAVDDRAASVITLAGAGAQGHAFAWCATMRRLLAARRPFVVVDDGDHDVEGSADRHARRCWMRAHAAELQTYCLGMVLVEPDVARRSRTRSSLSGLIEPLSLRVLVVSTAPLARQLADVLLMGARPVPENAAGGRERRHRTVPRRSLNGR